MTVRERMAKFLLATGYVATEWDKGNSHWWKAAATKTKPDGDPRFIFLGTHGSCRVGRARTRSANLAERVKREMEAWERVNG
jgi:hypothetical protein